MSVPVLSRLFSDCRRRTRSRSNGETSYTLPQQSSPRSDSGGRHPKGWTTLPTRQSCVVPAPLRGAARQTQPSEPILLPKLRIPFADFPYLHCSIPPEAAHLGDLLRLWVRRGARAQSNLPSLGFSRAVGSAPDATSSVALCRTSKPYLRPTRFQGKTPSRRKDNSSRDSRRRLRVRLRCRRRPKPTPHSRSGMLTRFPFGARHLRQASGTLRPKPSAPRETGALSGEWGRLPLPLGSTHPCPTAVHTEPFSTSVFKDLP